jgi:hypothetical protein
MRLTTKANDERYPDLLCEVKTDIVASPSKWRHNSLEVTPMRMLTITAAMLALATAATAQFVQPQAPMQRNLKGERK